MVHPATHYIYDSGLQKVFFDKMMEWWIYLCGPKFMSWLVSQPEWSKVVIVEEGDRFEYLTCWLTSAMQTDSIHVLLFGRGDSTFNDCNMFSWNINNILTLYMK